MNNKKEYILLTIMCLVLFPLFLGNYNSFVVLELGEAGDNENNNTSTMFFITHSQIDNDTAPPNITFIQPSLNNTEILAHSYTIIVEIVDENVPISGNVITEISNLTSFLFNASMEQAGGDQWIFTWDNITSYTNFENYFIRIWAKDSSLNGNYRWSPPMYVRVSISSSPNFINVFLYIFFVIVIFAGIMFYFNRKRAPSLLKKKTK